MPTFTERKGENNVELQSGAERLRNVRRRAKWVKKRVVDGQSVFLSESREGDMEIWDFPATFVAREGAESHPGDIELKYKNIENIR